MADVTLRHTIRREGEQKVFFYDGELTAKDGRLTIPADRPDWVKRAWLLGYRLDGKDKELATWPQVEAKFKISA